MTMRFFFGCGGTAGLQTRPYVAVLMPGFLAS